MSGQSPDVVLYDSSGNALAVANAAVIPTSAIMSAGSDGTDLRFLAVNSSGQQIIVGPAAAGVATSGNPVLIAGSDGTNVRTLLMDASSRQIVAGAGTAGTATGGVLTIQGVSGGVTVPVSGTVTATNASVSTTATAAPGSATYVGGAVQALQSGLTTGDMYPLSMTTAGLLRVDGSNVTQPVSIAAAVTVAQATAANLNATVVGTVTSNQGTANTLANAWSAKITDATNGPAAVKAASTAAVATDPALVVAISPNNSLTLSTADVTGTGALGALNAAVQVVTAGLSTAGFQLAAGTLIGTIIPEVSFDGGTTWISTYFDTPTSGKVATIVFASSNAATAATIVGVGGSGISRVRVSAYSSGTANITVRATTRTDPSVLFTGPQASATFPPDIAWMGASVSTSSPSYTNATLNALSLTTAGALRIDGSAVTQPVSGTVTANAGTGNFIVVGTASDNTTNSTAKLPVIAAVANTSAPTYVSGDMVPLSTDTSGNLRITGSISATNPSVSATGAAPPADATYAGGSVTTSAPTYTNGQMSPLSLDTSGNLRITGTISASNPSVGTTGSTTPTSATLIGGTDGTNLIAAKIKDASTAAVATDPSLVIAHSPNSSLPVGVNLLGRVNIHDDITIIHNSATVTTGGTIYVNGIGRKEICFGVYIGGAVTGGTPSLSYTVQEVDAVTNTFDMTLPGNSVVNGPFAATGHNNYVEMISYTGAVRVTWTCSGTFAGVDAWMVVKDATNLFGLTFSGISEPISVINIDSNDNTIVVGSVANGSAVVGNPVLTAGSDGTDVRTILTDTSSRQIVAGAGTAGTPAGGVLSIQGVSGGTSIPVTSTSSDSTATGALGALNAAVQITTAGYNSVGMQLAAGTLIGTLVAESSFDGGTTWNATVFNNATTSNNTSTLVFASSNTATAATLTGVGGTGLMRVRVSVYSSGTANVTLRASEVRDPSTLNGGPAAGSLPPTISQVGGSVTTGSPTYSNATLNALSLTTAGALRIDGSAVTQPVSGTVTGNQGTANTLANAWSTKITDATNGPAAVKAASTTAAATDPALVVAISPNLPTLTKGTQSAVGFAIQELKDAGRVPVTLMCSATAGVTTEALLSLTPNHGTTVGSAATTYAVTSGKTFRITAISVTVRNTSTVASGAIVNVRILAGTVLVSSPIIFSVGAAVNGAVSGQCGTGEVEIPDGFEISGTIQIGLTQIASATTCTLSVAVIGFEY